MLHSNFQSHQPFGFRDEHFVRCLTFMGLTAILIIWPGPLNKLLFPSPMAAPHEICLQSAMQLVSKEKKFENVESE